MDLQVFINLLEKINFGELVVIGGMFWFFYNRLDSKFEKLLDRLDNKFEKLFDGSNRKIDTLEGKMEQRFDRLDEKVTDIDRRLCRLEGAFSQKACCMLQDDSQMKKAE